jgi:hypothetical protein
MNQPNDPASTPSSPPARVLLGLWLKLYLGIHFVLTIGAETLARRYISLAYHQIPRRAVFSNA